MFGLGMGEMILIMGVALVVLGPEKFPHFAKIVIHAVRDLRGYWDEISREVSKELEPVKKELRELNRYKPEDYIESLSLAVSTEPKKSEKTEDKPSSDDTSEATPAASAPDSTAASPTAEQPTPAAPKDSVVHEHSKSAYDPYPSNEDGLD